MPDIIKAQHFRERRILLKTEKQLEIILKVRKEILKLEELCYKYQQYLENNEIIINSEENQEKLRECETKLTNIILAILDSQSTFSASKLLLDELRIYVNKKIPVPRKLKQYSEEEIEEVSIIDVLRRARNREEHPQKTNQRLYRLMADGLDFQIILQLLYKIDKLSLCEINSLSQKEFEKMITNSESLHSKIFLLQNEIEKKQEHILECENVTEEQKKVLQEFLNFIPNKKNVKIDYSTQKNDNK